MRPAYPSTQYQAPSTPLLAWLYERLYYELAWAYDPVSWLVSGGRWRHWQRAALPELTGSRVLEIGCGPGHFLIDLDRAGYRATGVDRSPPMWWRAGRLLARGGERSSVVGADARALPFAASSFDSIVLTFPTPVIYDATLWREMGRVLQSGGRVVVVLAARSVERSWSSLLERCWNQLAGYPPVNRDTATEMGWEADVVADARIATSAASARFAARQLVSVSAHGLVTVIVAERATETAR